jgi:hypothetical protein
LKKKEKKMATGLLIIGILLIVFVVKMFKFRSKALEYQEELKRAKSKVRIEQNRYLKTLKNTVENQNNVSSKDERDGNNNIFINSSSGSAQKYDTGSNMISELSLAYKCAQDELNRVIKEYNTLLIKFPNFIYASIFKFSKENYIDEDNLDSTTTLSDLDIDSI